MYSQKAACILSSLEVAVHQSLRGYLWRRTRGRGGITANIRGKTVFPSQHIVKATVSIFRMDPPAAAHIRPPFPRPLPPPLSNVEEGAADRKSAQAG